MDLSLEILEGEKIAADLENVSDQVAAAWRDPVAAAFLDKYAAACRTLSDGVRKLGDL